LSAESRMLPETEQLIRQAVRGVAEVRVGQRGLTLHRLPAWTTMYHDNDSMTGHVASCGSGVRLEVLTAATEITLTYRSTRDANTDGTWVSPPSVVTLTGAGEQGEEQLEPISISHDNGSLRLWNNAVPVRTTTGQDSVARFELPASPDGKLSDSPRALQLWLPHSCAIELIDLTANAPLAAAPNHQPKWVHYGSSISHGSEAAEPIGVWPVVAARQLGLDLFSLGLAGSANIEIFAAQVIAAQPADLITLKLGINTVNGNHLSRRVFIPAVHSFLDVIRAAHPTTPIVVISPIFCPPHEHNPGPTLGGLGGKATSQPDRDEAWAGNLNLTMIRDILANIVERRNDPNLGHMNGLAIFGPEDSQLMPDDLHPDSAGQTLMGNRAAEQLKLLLPKLFPVANTL